MARCLVWIAFAAAFADAEPRADRPKGWAGIRVVDAATGRGVPLVELETVNGLKFVTDNAGRVALWEPDLMGREVHFSVRSHGYAMPKDGFGFAGIRIVPKAGETAEIKLPRRNVAERLCRLTGEGLFRDSELLGHEIPLRDGKRSGRVAGQDSVAAAEYRGKVYWFWGDTSRMEYPLGLFRVAGAVTPRFDPKNSADDPASGIRFEYFADKSGFARAMMPLVERPEGVVWISAAATVPDKEGKTRLVAHYSRRKGLEKELEQGIALFDDEKQIFVPAKALPLTERWRRPSGHPILHKEGEAEWILFGSPTPNVRAPATFEALLDPDQYEAWTCAGAEPGKGRPVDFDADGKPAWRWGKRLPPTDSRTERQWVKEGAIQGEHVRFCPANAAAPEERIVLHSGSVRWNPHRRRWILIACQIGGKASLLGEVWYAEAIHPTGPFVRAVQIATHDRQSFYNVCHHAFLDRDEGRTIHFEGTYTNDFSGNPEKTPRYNYNQVLYRLDLDAPALKAARIE